ncbi:MAG: histidine--tRNA ligase [Lentisphaerae bacterium]|nr:histidine--tRNA ligase [Lentisphaerota bacterium]MBQ4328494.1 histidine--tRNA ligase [Lentisphaeria bacterium]
MAAFAPPPGTADIFPADAGTWRFLENTAAEVFSGYGYGELRTPIFEYTEVFQRGLGGETEVVQKEMYTFEDRGGRSLTLRPEGTAGVMRALTNTDVANGTEQRVFYYGPMFRGERPSAGRRRQFHQIGVENVGRCAALIDAECIAMLHSFLEKAGITGAVFTINTRGVAADRAPAEAHLREYFSKHISKMCDDCRTRLERNIWRILDCKQECCQEIIDQAPSYIDSFSEDSKAYFEEVKAALTALNVPFKVSPRLVRGLDYYVHTVFEVTHDALGEQIAIAGGGRYELFLPGEKKPLPGVGFAAGVERLIMVREALNAAVPDTAAADCYLIGLGADARMKNLILADKLRNGGKKIALELEERSFKAQMRSANRSGAALTVIRGESEMEKGIAIIKKMDDGSQCEVSENELFDYLLKHI